MEAVRLLARAGCHAFVAAALCMAVVSPANAAGGYFVLGYGPYAHQSAGTSTAVGLDGFSASSNPAKLSAVGERLDLSVLFFLPYRRVERTESGTPYDFTSKSKNSFFVLPEVGYARRINQTLSWGISLYGNGGLNTEYADDNGVPGSNANPARCGDQPGNFLFGCGKLGFDLSQLIVAPTLSWEFEPGYSIGIAPLIGYQRIKVYGLQAFEGISSRPDAVSNNGYDDAFGGGVRIGWYGRVNSWLDLGVAYSTRIYMEKFRKYRGLFADGGDFDIPSNFSFGAAFKPHRDWVLAVDLHRILFGEIHALNNGVLPSLQDPVNTPLGDRNGSGFNWQHQTNYRGMVSYAVSPRLTLRAGYAYGRPPQADHSLNSVTFNMLAPNPRRNATAGFTWRHSDKNEFNFAYGRYMDGDYEGPSASAGLGIGGREKVEPAVETYMLGWSRHF